MWVPGKFYLTPMARRCDQFGRSDTLQQPVDMLTVLKIFICSSALLSELNFGNMSLKSHIDNSRTASAVRVPPTWNHLDKRRCGMQGDTWAAVAKIRRKLSPADLLIDPPHRLTPILLQCLFSGRQRQLEWFSTPSINSTSMEFY